MGHDLAEVSGDGPAETRRRCPESRRWLWPAKATPDAGHWAGGPLGGEYGAFGTKRSAGTATCGTVTVSGRREQDAGAWFGCLLSSGPAG